MFDSFTTYSEPFFVCAQVVIHSEPSFDGLRLRGNDDIDIPRSMSQIVRNINLAVRSAKDQTLLWNEIQEASSGKKNNSVLHSTSCCSCIVLMIRGRNVTCRFSIDSRAYLFKFLVTSTRFVPERTFTELDRH
jgi:hypothetical protein